MPNILSMNTQLKMIDIQKMQHHGLVLKYFKGNKKYWQRKWQDEEAIKICFLFTNKHLQLPSNFYPCIIAQTFELFSLKYKPTHCPEAICTVVLLACAHILPISYPFVFIQTQPLTRFSFQIAKLLFSSVCFDSGCGLQHQIYSEILQNI